MSSPLRRNLKHRVTLPVRAARAGVRAVRAAALGRPAVLMYHHVADTPTDPWKLAVTPEHFRTHLSLLRKSGRRMLTLDQLVNALQAGEPVHRAVVITFDDGYADNARIALPALEQAEIPATVFVTSGAIDSCREMWWDELERIILTTPDLPEALELDIAGEQLVERLDAGPPTGTGWYADEQPATHRRQQLYLEIWRRLSPLCHADQRAVLDQLATWAGVDVAPRETHRMVTSAELDRLARSDLVEIGSHTVTHPSLRHTPDLDHELRESKRELERRTAAPVTSFAYPSGHHDAAVTAAVAAAGYRCAVTTEDGPVLESDDPLLLPRFVVADQGGPRFAKFLAQLG